MKSEYDGWCVKRRKAWLLDTFSKERRTAIDLFAMIYNSCPVGMAECTFDAWYKSEGYRCVKVKLQEVE